MLVRLSEILTALDECVGDYRLRRKTHHLDIRTSGGKWGSLPKGDGKVNPEIQAGHVRKLARKLGIEECLNSNIKGLSP
jgi:hypothetical protein